MERVAADQVEILAGDTVTRGYILQGKEMFARAFHQYVAIRSRNPTLLKEIESLRRDRYLSFQVWGEKEFEPIAAAFDKLLADAGIAV